MLALILGALLIQGVTPGPELVADHPDIFWGLMASMLIGNIILLLLLNIPLLGVFVQILRVRVGVLAALAVLVTMLGGPPGSVFPISAVGFKLPLGHDPNSTHAHSR